jgi:hypothetical protein
MHGIREIVAYPEILISTILSDFDVLEHHMIHDCLQSKLAYIRSQVCNHHGSCLPASALLWPVASTEVDGSLNFSQSHIHLKQLAQLIIYQVKRGHSANLLPLLLLLERQGTC